LAQNDEVKQLLFMQPSLPSTPVRERILQGGLKSMRWAVRVGLGVVLFLGAWQLSNVAVPALGRLMHLSWIYDTALSDALQNPVLQNPETITGSRKLCDAARLKHEKAFSNWTNLGNCREQFLNIWPRAVVTSEAGQASAQAAAG
jgi:hypothetical protein